MGSEFAVWGQTWHFWGNFGSNFGDLGSNFAFLGQFSVKLCVFGATLVPVLGFGVKLCISGVILGPILRIWGQTLHFWSDFGPNVGDLGSNFAFSANLGLHLCTTVPIFALFPPFYPNFGVFWLWGRTQRGFWVQKPQIGVIWGEVLSAFGAFGVKSGGFGLQFGGLGSNLSFLGSNLGELS